MCFSQRRCGRKLFELACQMPAPKELLTREQYEALNSAEGWKITALDDQTIRDTPGIQRKHDLLGGYVSGDCSDVRRINGREAILGMDILVHESLPKTSFGEADVNVYHYVVTKTGRTDFPYCLHGPFTKEALQSHWPPDLDLTPYAQNGTD